MHVCVCVCGFRIARHLKRMLCVSRAQNDESAVAWRALFTTDKTSLHTATTETEKTHSKPQHHRYSENMRMAEIAADRMDFRCARIRSSLVLMVTTLRFLQGLPSI